MKNMLKRFACHSVRALFCKSPKQSVRTRLTLEELDARICPAEYAFAQNANAAAVWSDVRNWTVNGVAATKLPGAGDDVLLSGTTQSIVDKAFTVDAVTLTQAPAQGQAGMLILWNTLTVNKGFTLNQGRTVYAPGGSLVLSSGSSSYIYADSAIKGAPQDDALFATVTVQAKANLTIRGDLTLNNVAFNNMGSVTVTGPDQNSSLSSWTFTDTVFTNYDKSFFTVDGVKADTGDWLTMAGTQTSAFRVLDGATMTLRPYTTVTLFASNAAGVGGSPSFYNRGTVNLMRLTKLSLNNSDLGGVFNFQGAQKGDEFQPKIEFASIAKNVPTTVTFSGAVFGGKMGDIYVIGNPDFNEPVNVVFAANTTTTFANRLVLFRSVKTSGTGGYEVDKTGNATELKIDDNNGKPIFTQNGGTALAFNDDGSLGTVTESGTLMPGDQGVVNVLTVQNYLQAADGTLAMDLGGAGVIAGTDYDQLIVSGGQLSLGGTLQLNILPTFSAQVGTVLTLIDNNEASLPLTTTFAGMPDGTQITIGGWGFRINYNSTSNTDGTNHNTVILTVVSTPETSSNTASVSGAVWVDQNGDGIDETSEPPAVGIGVTLIDLSTGNSIYTVTDDNGAYGFQSLAAGNYEVQFDPTTNSTYASYRFTTNNADSLAIPSTGITAPFPLSDSQQLANISAGLVSNTPPAGVDDSYAVNSNGSLNVSATAGVLTNDTDAANDPLTASLVNGPQNGTLSLNADGSFIYTPNANFVGMDTFSYRPADPYGPGSTATVTITVTGSSPVVDDPSETTDMDSSLTMNLLDGASDLNGETLTVADVSDCVDGEVAINSDGTVSYTPLAGWYGTDSFQYTIQDSSGDSTTKTMSVTVNPVTGQPVANPLYTVTSQTTDMDFDLGTLASDTNAAASNLTYTVSGAQNGAVALLDDGHTADFTPTNGYHGYASFIYTATDVITGLSASAIVTVSIDSPPTAFTDPVSTDMGASITLNVLSSDYDPDGDALLVTDATDGSHGTTEFTPDGTIIYTPNAGFFGTDSFQYTIYDGFGGVTTATVNITVNAVPPTANPDTVTTQQGTSVSVDLSTLASDVNMPSANLTYSVSGAQGGSVALLGDGHTAQFTPMSGFTGQAQFTYTVTDPTTGLSASSVVTVTVNGTGSGGTGNSPPLATGYTATASSSPITLSIQALASDPNGYSLTIISVTQGTGGTVTIAPDGQSLTYTGPYPASSTDSFTYTVSDGHGGTATGTVTIYP